MRVRPSRRALEPILSDEGQLFGSHQINTPPGSVRSEYGDRIYNRTSSVRYGQRGDNQHKFVAIPRSRGLA